MTTPISDRGKIFEFPIFVLYRHAYHQKLPIFGREIDSKQNLGTKINLSRVMTTPISDRGKIFEYPILILYSHAYHQNLPIF